MVNLGELGEQISGAAFMLGTTSGIDIAAKKIRSRSGEFFAKGQDKEAKIWRGIADYLDELHKATRSDYDSYRPQKEAAFKKLDEVQRVLAEQLEAISEE